MEDIIVKGTGAKPWLDKRLHNTNYTSRADKREPNTELYIRGALKSVRSSADATMNRIVALLVEGASAREIRLQYPVAYFRWSSKIRQFISDRDKDADSSTPPNDEDE